MEERTGEAFEMGEQLTLVGKKLLPGEQAPGYILDYLDPTDSAIHRVRLEDSAGTVRLLNVVNSLDTPVCHVETRRWEELRADLPSTQARWQAAEGVKHRALSAHRSDQFGHDYGVLIKEWRLLQRAVFVIDQHDRVVYAEYVADQMREPDYPAALEATRQS